MNYLDLLIYLDQNLTENLNSLVLNGYIQKHTSRWIEDRTLTGKAHNETHEQSFDENRCMKDKRDGYKTTTATNAATQTNWIENVTENEKKALFFAFFKIKVLQYLLTGHIGHFCSHVLQIVDNLANTSFSSGSNAHLFFMYSALSIK